MDAAKDVLGEHGYVLTPSRGRNALRTQDVPGEPYSPAKPVFSRALNLEWEILQRVEPGFASAVEEQVDLYLSSRHPPASSERP